MYKQYALIKSRFIASAPDADGNIEVRAEYNVISPEKVGIDDPAHTNVEQFTVSFSSGEIIDWDTISTKVLGLDNVSATLI